ncbi:hypothetical protein V8B97DRAFT_1853970, partial [Scleroderma yunnanense]
ICHEIVSHILSSNSHDFQLDAITRLLDGKDVLLIIATGIGKINTFIHLMHDI